VGLEEPKTEKSRRAVPLLAHTVDALRWHRTRQEVERITAGSAYTDNGFVFATATGEPLQGTVVYKYHWRPTLKRLGLAPVRLHDLRHSTSAETVATDSDGNASVRRVLAGEQTTTAAVVGLEGSPVTFHEHGA
jgi:integrase